MCLECYVSALGYLEQSEFIKISYWNTDYATCFARIIYHIILQLGISEIMTNNFNPWSYVIYDGQGYLVNNVVSTKHVVDIARLYSYLIILNHPISWLIILMT